MTDFLQSVLPETGTYCIVGIKDNRPKQTFYSDLDEAMERAQTLDSHGVDAYFALAAFNTESRKAQDARALKAFFADIDCGENKPYASHADAAQALRKFLTDTSLPDPIVVNSGGGLHIYWPLTQEVAPARWKPAAEALKEFKAASQHMAHSVEGLTGTISRFRVE